MTQVSLKSGSRCSACSATSKKSGKSGKLLTRSGKLSKRVSRNVPEKGLEQQRKKRGSTDDLHAINHTATFKGVRRYSQSPGHKSSKGRLHDSTINTSLTAYANIQPRVKYSYDARNRPGQISFGNSQEQLLLGENNN